MAYGRLHRASYPWFVLVIHFTSIKETSRVRAQPWMMQYFHLYFCWYSDDTNCSRGNVIYNNVHRQLHTFLDSDSPKTMLILSKKWVNNLLSFSVRWALWPRHLLKMADMVNFAHASDRSGSLAMLLSLKLNRRHITPYNYLSSHGHATCGIPYLVFFCETSK